LIIASQWGLSGVLEVQGLCPCTTPVPAQRAADKFFIALILINSGVQSLRMEQLGQCNECEAEVLVSSLAEQAPKDVLKNDTAL
jgi:hypothetical protein